MASPVKIGIGNITDTSFSNFMQVAAALKPGDSAYDKSLQRLIAAGGDDLKGVSDPLEKILSAVSSHVEKNGLSGVFLDRYNRFREALDAGEEMSHASKLFYGSLDFGKKMYETPVPTSTITPSVSELKEAGISLPSDKGPAKVEVSSKQQGFLESIKAEKAAKESAAFDAIPATKKSIEESGYLYHYAPREARESILSGGLQVSKARTAVADTVGEFSEFSKYVPENSMYFFTNPNDAPSAGTIFGSGEGAQRPDLYRVKIEPGMLDDMVVDPRLPLRERYWICGDCTK